MTSNKSPQALLISTLRTYNSGFCFYRSGRRSSKKSDVRAKTQKKLGIQQLDLRTFKVLFEALYEDRRGQTVEIYKNKPG